MDAPHNAEREYSHFVGDPYDMFAEDGAPTAEDWARLSKNLPSACQYVGELHPCGARTLLRVYHAAGDHPDAWHFNAQCSDGYHWGHGFLVDAQTWARPTRERWSVFNSVAFPPTERQQADG